MSTAFFYDSRFLITPGKKSPGSQEKDVSISLSERLFCSRDILCNSLGLGEQSVLDCSALISREIPPEIDTLVWPYGGYFPRDAFGNLKAFLKRGGNLIVLGSAPFWTSCFFEDGKWASTPQHREQNLWLCEFANELGISSWGVHEDSELGSENPSFEILPEFAKIFGSASKLDCKRFWGSLHPLDSGRRVVIGQATEGSSPNPGIREFITLIESSANPDINGRILSAGITPAENWSEQNYRDFIRGLVKIMELDEKNRLTVGMKLSGRIIRQESNITCSLWKRLNSSASPELTVKLVNASDGKTLESKIVSISDQSGEISQVSPLTQSLPKGAYKVILETDGREILSSRFSILDKPSAKPPVVKAGRVNGYGAFEIDGKTVPALDYCLVPSDLALDKLTGDFGGAGVHVFTIQYQLRSGWKGQSKYDWSSFDALAERVLRSDPDAYLFPRIDLRTPKWWNERNGDELGKYYHGTNNREASWRSEKWQSDCKDMLADFAAHTRSSVYGSRMFGYFFMNCGEWNVPIADGMCWEDISDVAMEDFRKWLGEQYPLEAERLEKWKNLEHFSPDDVQIPDTNFLRQGTKYHHLDDPQRITSMSHMIPPERIDQALVPNIVRRHIGKYGIFRDPAQSWDAIEYYRYAKDFWSYITSYFSTVLKEATGGDALTGCFTCYLLQEYLCDTDSGHREFALRKILDEAKDLDVCTSPYYYYRVENVTGDANCKAPHGSVNLSDKLFLDENDQRTCLASRYNNSLYGTPGETIEETAEAIKRNFIIRLTRGAGLWWFDFGFGWYNHPLIMDTIKRCREIHQEVLTKPASHNMTGCMDSLNVLYSTEAYDYLVACSNWARCNTANHIQRHFNRNGFPWEVYLPEDMHHMPARGACLFLNTFAIDDQQRAYIDSELKKDGNILIWLYAAGLYNNDVASIDNCSELTGFKLDWDMEWREIDIKISDFTHPATASLRNADLENFGSHIADDAHISISNAKIAPRIYSVDPEAANLGIMAGTDKVGFAVKDFGTWKSVFISSPIVPHQVMRGLMQWAGMTPTLNTDDALYTNGDLIGIHAKLDGEKIITLPQEGKITDMFEDKVYRSADKVIKLDMRKGQTFIGRINKG